jgi:hypothetical protein
MRARLAALDKLLRARFECGAGDGGGASGGGEGGGGGVAEDVEAPRFMVALPAAPPPPPLSAVHSILSAAVAALGSDDALEATATDGGADGRAPAAWADVDAAPAPARAPAVVASKVIAPTKIGLKLAASVAPKPRAVVGFDAE